MPISKNQAFCDWPPRIPRRITIVTASEAALAKLWLRSVSITSAAPLLLSPWWRTSKRSGRLCKCGFFLHPHLTSTKKLLGKNYHGFDVEVEDSVVIKLFTLQKNYFKKTCEKVSHKGRHKLLRSLVVKRFFGRPTWVTRKIVKRVSNFLQQSLSWLMY